MSRFPLSQWWQSQRILLAPWLVFAWAIVLLYFFLYAALQQPWLSHNGWDSYVLQAAAWWHGKIALDHDYSYLELAYFNQNIFVSFPPVPTVPHFFLYPIFGENTPNNLMNTVYAVIAFLLAVRLLRGIYDWSRHAIAICAVFGSNALVLSVCGGVWFQAQLLAMLLTLLSFVLLCSEKLRPSRIHLSLLALALAVGCRPLTLVYFPLLALLIVQRTGLSLCQVAPRFVWLPAAVGGIYAIYNYVRFDNPLEFGHTYLPEFQQAVLGQFNWRYIPENFLKSWQLPYWTEKNGLSFPRFNGMLFFLVNPIFVIFVLKLPQWKARWTLINVVLLLTLLLHALATFAHKTMGGWQFGNRYFVDFIPVLLLFMRLNRVKANLIDVLLCVFGVAINIYGTLWLFLEWP